MKDTTLNGTIAGGAVDRTPRLGLPGIAQGNSRLWRTYL